MCLAQGNIFCYALTQVRHDPPATRSQVKHSTTEPLRSLLIRNDPTLVDLTNFFALCTNEKVYLYNYS